ncbi:MAG: NAD-glutamate dehydrogenase [Nitriliruptorales bacterium]|nr:NAD-glutamate dehydrogenase [Nitriliruptorales bacterium]
MSAMPDGGAELIADAVALARQRLEAERADQVERFIRQYYRVGGVPPEDLAERAAGDLYGAALSHWSQARQRRPGEFKVKVFNPRIEEHGWQSTHTVVEITGDDMPFLVDSVRMELTRHGLGIHLLVHPVMTVRRDGEGNLVEVLEPGTQANDALDEAITRLEVDRQTDLQVVERLTADLCRVLGDVRAAVGDWGPMRARARAVITDLTQHPPPVDEKEWAEALDLLRWMHEDNFTFLGYREYELASVDGDDALRGVPGSGLGILRDQRARTRSGSFERLPPRARRLARAPYLLNLTKANARATVHRPTYLDYVGVKRFDEQGQVVGECRFLGLYTSSVYHSSVLDIPVVRGKAVRVLERSGFAPSSHGGRELVAILETYPRDELFQISEDELFRIAMGILNLQERQRVRLFMRRDPFGRFWSCILFVPRDRYNTQTRIRMQEILRGALDGIGVDQSARLSESVLARLYLVIRTEPGREADVDVTDLERRLASAVRSWTDALHDSLIEHCGEELGIKLYHRYGEAFPPGYRDDVPAPIGVVDIERIERLEGERDLGMSLYHPPEADMGRLRFKLYRCGPPISLSDVLPRLETMGVRVLDQRPYEIHPTGRPPAWIYDFGLDAGEAGELDTEEVKDTFSDAFARLWHGETENDGFNRLVLRARLPWRDILVLRAYAKYLRQVGSRFSQTYMEQALTAHPRIARQLVGLFHERFDPDRGDGAARGTGASVTAITEAIDQVTGLDEDRILRGFLALIQATVRTNHYQRSTDGRAKPYLSLKLDPEGVPDLPLPRPAYEIFVYSPQTEGIHLRGGKVARGGLRWSDRREDFRTEVLGLVKAQTVKNAVIVPVGAKGGFVVKRPPADRSREAMSQQVRACYATFVRGLLDLTDNLVNGEVRPPERVVRYDDDDPYLVVAADKGTATFSDLANSIAKEYGYWPGDAFASGGSTGYDHKKMGITARGAWESVKRHFRELGIDVPTTEVSVVGIGDMSGDVFGNGMLLSPQLKLVGAFDHRHVFLDPDPDPEVSFRERERMFALPRSSWADYDRGAISAGGGVWPRSAKSVTLSPEARRALGVAAGALTPSEVISALLRAPVDLLWNGGIGTFVKASDESHAKVGDKANDTVRVNANELRCRVVGEGGNLGLTQRARIEYALGGGRVNTDAIDNSAGVDCSDHEVNIKILVDAVVDAGDLTRKQRNILLEELTEDVAGLVLRDNQAQTQAISNAAVNAGAMVNVHRRYLRSLEQAGRLDRGLEFLPDDQVLDERASDGRGLTSPEFAVLLAYSKIALKDELLDSDAPDDPYLSVELERYFPTALRERFGKRMYDHRLRREIIATCLSNTIVNEAGMTFVHRLGEETGAPSDEVARAFTVAREVFDVEGMQASIVALDNQVAAETQTAMILDARRLVERATRWLLRPRRPIDITAMISRYAHGPAALGALLPEVLSGAEREAIERAGEALIAQEVPPGLAGRVAVLDIMLAALPLVEVEAKTGEPIQAAASIYFLLSEKLELGWLRRRITALPRDDRWQTLARDAMRDDFFSQHRALTAAVLHATGREDPPEARLASWLAQCDEPVQRCLSVLGDLQAGDVHDLAGLSVALRELRLLA